MSIDKALYAAHLGMPADAEEDGIEIEIEDPEAVHIRAGDLEIDIEPGEEEEEDFNANLAEEMEESELQSLVGEILDEL